MVFSHPAMQAYHDWLDEGSLFFPARWPVSTFKSSPGIQLGILNLLAWPSTRLAEAGAPWPPRARPPRPHFPFVVFLRLRLSRAGRPRRDPAGSRRGGRAHAVLLGHPRLHPDDREPPRGSAVPSQPSGDSALPCFRQHRCARYGKTILPIAQHAKWRALDLSTPRTIPPTTLSLQGTSIPGAS